MGVRGERGESLWRDLFLRFISSFESFGNWQRDYWIYTNANEEIRELNILFCRFTDMTGTTDSTEIYFTLFPTATMIQYSRLTLLPENCSSMRLWTVN